VSAGQPLTKIARLIDLVPKLVEAMPGHSGGSFKLSLWRVSILFCLFINYRHFEKVGSAVYFQDC